MRKLRRNAGGKHAKLATFILIERHKQRPYHRSPDSSLSHEALQANKALPLAVAYTWQGGVSPLVLPLAFYFISL